MKAYIVWIEVLLYSFLTLTLDGGVVNFMTQALYPLKRMPVPIEWEGSSASELL